MALCAMSIVAEAQTRADTAVVDAKAAATFHTVHLVQEQPNQPQHIARKLGKIRVALEEGPREIVTSERRR